MTQPRMGQDSPSGGVILYLLYHIITFFAMHNPHIAWTILIFLRFTILRRAMLHAFKISILGKHFFQNVCKFCAEARHHTWTFLCKKKPRNRGSPQGVIPYGKNKIRAWHSPTPSLRQSIACNGVIQMRNR